MAIVSVTAPVAPVHVAGDPGKMRENERVKVIDVPVETISVSGENSQMAVVFHRSGDCRAGYRYYVGVHPYVFNDMRTVRRRLLQGAVAAVQHSYSIVIFHDNVVSDIDELNPARG